ncbi:MAG: biopolymer transporter ExbD [Zetaproteobacteria bacterium]|nr:MAG: biopolymer transporter ExbD [Zetaproteobacteria bacterium]
MQFEGLRRGAHAPNLTPLIDIVFLLLVFFMLTAHFVKDERLDVQLPESESALSDEDDAAIELVLDRQNRVYLDDTQVPLAELAERLRLALRSRSNKHVKLRGDRGTNLRHVVAVLDAAKKAGASGVDIVTRRP